MFLNKFIMWRITFKCVCSLLVPFLVVCGLSSCEDDKSVVYGVTKFYDSFLFEPYEPVRMERVLDLSFNEDAIRLLKGKSVEFELRRCTPDGDESAEGIKLYANGALCDQNRFKIAVGEKEVRLAIEFMPDIEEGYHSYILKDVTPNGSLFDRIELEGFSKGDRIQVKKEVVMNPLKKTLIISAIILLTLCALWFIISRFVIWKSTSFSKVFIDYNDGYGQISISMSGCYELVCTNNLNQKDSVFEKIIKGRRKYVVNDVWVNPIVIKDGYRKNKIQILGAKEYDISGETERTEAFDLINPEGRKITIETT